MRTPSSLSILSTVTLPRCLAWVGTIALLLLSQGLAQALLAQDRSNPTREPRGGGLIALKVGTIHPVSSPTIQNGVILIRRGRIFAVGPVDKVNIPDSAKVEEYPNAHAYPGLVDALSTAFTTPRELSNAGVNAGTDFADALDATDEESRKLIRYGITTVYVSNRSTATWRGRGAIVRPNQDGFSTLGDQLHGGLSLRMTTGDSAGHALDRLRKFDRTGNVFDSLEAYEKKQKDYKKALADYEKKFKTYLDHHRKKKKKKAKPAGTKKDADEKPDASPPATGKDGNTRGERRGRRAGGERRGGSGDRRRGGSGGRGRRPGGSPAGARSAPAAGKPTPGGPDKSKTSKTSKTSAASSVPKKPKWPKRVEKDQAKEALLQVVAGKLPLRIEVHRHDEIRAAMFMAMIKELPNITLEFASDAGDIAKEIAEAGAAVVVTDLLPTANDLARNRNRAALPASLHRAGVEVAIGSGDVRNARNLTMMAAYACGHGLPVDAAIRALTLTPAKILGVDDQIGSLERNKVADVLITSGPLLNSNTRVLRVIARGKTQYEAK